MVCLIETGNPACLNLSLSETKTKETGSRWAGSLSPLLPETGPPELEDCARFICKQVGHLCVPRSRLDVQSYQNDLQLLRPLSPPTGEEWGEAAGRHREVSLARTHERMHQPLGENCRVVLGGTKVDSGCWVAHPFLFSWTISKPDPPPSDGASIQWANWNDNPKVKKHKLYPKMTEIANAFLVRVIILSESGFLAVLKGSEAGGELGGKWGLFWMSTNRHTGSTEPSHSSSWQLSLLDVALALVTVWVDMETSCNQKLWAAWLVEGWGKDGITLRMSLTEGKL